jgi:hypothetical protein
MELIRKSRALYSLYKTLQGKVIKTGHTSSNYPAKSTILIFKSHYFLFSVFSGRCETGDSLHHEKWRKVS